MRRAPSTLLRAGPSASLRAGPPASPATRRAGFTLVELMVAAALLLIFGAMAVATLRYGSGLWRVGHRRSYAYDTATAVFHLLENDIQATRSSFWGRDTDAFDSRIMFLVDYDQYDPDGPAGLIPASQRPRLRFVRGIPDDAVNPRVRQAGDGVDNDGDGNIDEESYNLIDDDGDVQVDEDLMPLEGMCEVAYMMGTQANDSKTLYRAVLAPIGGANRLFDPANVADPAAVGQALTENVVLHFEVRLWTQYTTTWDDSVGLAPWYESFQPEPCGPGLDWDSRAGTQTLMTDDIFPRAVMVALAVEPPERLRPMGRLRLAQRIAEDALTIPVMGSLPAYNTSWPYVLIGDPAKGDEWVRFGAFNPATQSFVVGSTSERGVRGTTAIDHATGNDVTFGYTFCAVFQNPAFRDYWGQ